MNNNNLSLKGKRVLITGIKGFIGSNLQTTLVLLGAQVFGICLNDENESEKNGSVKFYHGNLVNTLFVQNVIEDCDPEYVIHLAGSTDRSRAITTFSKLIDENIKTSCVLFECLAQRSSLKSVLIVGTAEEYGSAEKPFKENFLERPVSAYSFSKLCINKLALSFYDLYQLPIKIVRPSIVYGPTQRGSMFIPSLVDTLTKGSVFKMTEGNQKRDFIYIDDFISALIAVSEHNTCIGEIINISYGKSVCLKKVANAAEVFFGVKGLVLIGSEPYRIGEIMNYRVNNSKLRKLTGWKPKINIKSGLKKTIEEFVGNKSET